MEAVSEETKDDTMEDEAMYSSNTTPMQTSAQLAKKLKKLMQTESTKATMEEAMAIDANDAKKRASA